MDSLRKKAPAAPKPITKPQKATPAFPLIAKKREELFISRSEAQRMDQCEKKFQKRINIKKVVAIVLVLLISIALVLAAYFLWKTYDVGKKINSEAGIQTTFAQSVRALASPVISPSSRTPLKGEDSGRINILLLGAAGEHKPGGNLTDTVMIMNIDTKNKKVALFSLPRDFYAPIPASKSYAKINSLYPIGIKEGQGIDLIKGAAEEITGLSINYYVVVDFNSFEKIIDNIGGINIVSPRDIYDPTYPGPNYSYQTFSLSKGFHELDGATALKYVRERHDDPEGDFGRAKRQQQVIQAVKNKMFSLQTLFNVVALNNILDTMGDNIKTDIAVGDLESFIALSKTIDLENISNVVVDAWKKDSLLKVSHVQTGSGNAFILIPRVGNYSEIQELAKNIFNQEEIRKRRELIADENAVITITNKSGDRGLENKIKSLLSERLGMKNVSLVSNPDDSIAEFTTVSQKASGGKMFTLDELIKKIPAKISEADLSDTDDDTDLAITLGKDIVETYGYDEDSIEDFNKAQDEQEGTSFNNLN